MCGLDVHARGGGWQPRAKEMYLSNYGWNFSKRACEVAVGELRKRNTISGKSERVKMVEKKQVDALLKRYNIVLEEEAGYNHVYLWNWAKVVLADVLRDDEMVARYVKAVIDDHGMPGGNVFRRWYVDHIERGKPVEWEDLIDEEEEDEEADDKAEGL